MATNRKRKHWAKIVAAAAVVVVGWDLLKAHTGIARPHSPGASGPRPGAN